MNSWVNSVNWNENDIGYASSQNSLFVVLNFKSDKNQIVYLKHSPIIKILPKGCNEFFAVDFNRNIYLYECIDNKWNIKKEISKNNLDDNNINDENNNDKKGTLVVKMKKNPLCHPSNISSFNIHGNEIITSDLSGFIKFWNKINDSRINTSNIFSKNKK